MKKLIIAAGFSAIASVAGAGGMNDPVVTPTVAPDVVMQDTVESAGSDDWVGVTLVILTINVAGLGSQ